MLNEKPFWLDPARDHLSLKFSPETKEIECRWIVADHEAYGLQIVMRAAFIAENCLILEYSFSIPRQLLNASVKMWHIFSPEILGNRRFQCAMAGSEGENCITAFSGNTCLGIFSSGPHSINNETGFSIAKVAQRGRNPLGITLNAFVHASSAFRDIEMGHVLGLALSHELNRALSPSSSHLTPGRATHVIGVLAGENPEELVKKWRSLNPGTFFSRGEFPKTLPRDVLLRNSSLAVLRFLTDSTGALIAAPEMDLDFVQSGGYGYVWPRDAAFCALSLLKVGEIEHAEKILEFLAQIQESNGDYFQRYDARGFKAPSWGKLQADELGLTCVAFSELLLTKQNECLRSALLKGIHRIIHVLEKQQGRLEPSFDLWEESFGQHFYANVCAYEALEKASLLFPELKLTIQKSQESLIKTTKRDFFQDNVLCCRGFSAESGADRRYDISMLACVFPCSSFPMEPSAQVLLWKAVHTSLMIAQGAKRYERDAYMGGHPWILATLWLACAGKNLAPFDAEIGQEAARLFELVQGQATAGGFFPEQVCLQNGTPHWVLPLAWSHAFYLWAERAIN